MLFLLLVFSQRKSSLETHSAVKSSKCLKMVQHHFCNNVTRDNFQENSLRESNFTSFSSLGSSVVSFLETHVVAVKHGVWDTRHESIVKTYCSPLVDVPDQRWRGRQFLFVCWRQWIDIKIKVDELWHEEVGRKNVSQLLMFLLWCLRTWLCSSRKSRRRQHPQEWRTRKEQESARRSYFYSRTNGRLSLSVCEHSYLSG